jgi:hypothetical protein
MKDNELDDSGSGNQAGIAICAVVGIIVLSCVCCCVCYFLSLSGFFLYNVMSTSQGDIPLPAQSANSKILFSDTFDSNINGWAEGTFPGEFGTITYVINGGYWWNVNAAKPVNHRSWPDQGSNLVDFITEVDATHLSGATDSSYGIVYRLVNDSNMYYFCISDLGYYAVWLLKDDNWITLIDWTETDYINVKGLNKLEVIGMGDEFSFFINDNGVGRIQDSSLPTGATGLAVELYDDGDTAAFKFDNFKISTP